jgi:isopenicillin N synthase-like dioxygenase
MKQVELVHKLSRQFFEMPTSVKNKYKKPDPIRSYHGYFGPGDEFFNEKEKNSIELRELFDISGLGHDESHFPMEVEGFKAAVDEFRSQCNNLIKKLLRCIAIYLKLDDPDFFVKNHTGIEKYLEKTHGGIRTMYYYPMNPKPVDLPPNAIRLGEHTDWGSITLLFQDMTGGLEVKKTNGEWVHATPVKDAVLINCGQLLEHWTAGILPATPHRVRIMDDEYYLNNPRQSLIYFVSPDGHVEVKPVVEIPEEKKEEYKNKKPIVAYDHYQRLIDYATS